MSSWSKNEKIKEEKTLKNEFHHWGKSSTIFAHFYQQTLSQNEEKKNLKTKQKKPCNTKKTKNLCFFGPNLINIRKRIWKKNANTQTNSFTAVDFDNSIPSSIILFFLSLSLSLYLWLKFHEEKKWIKILKTILFLPFSLNFWS